MTFSKLIVVQARRMGVTRSWLGGQPFDTMQLVLSICHVDSRRVCHT